MSLAQTLAEFTLYAAPDAASEGAQAIMRLSLYDWAACGISGSSEPVAQILRASKPEQPEGVGVFGSAARYSPTDAALINGATSHALDYDDTHFGHIGHPSVAVLPAVLAAGGAGDPVWAALVGAELSVRVGLWLGRTHYQTGFHQTATAGAFGATAAAGRLMGLSRAQMEAAFGLAATQAAGLKSQFGTMGKPYHAGLAARTGIEAAGLAKAGFDTRGAGLDGPQGFGPTHHGEADAGAFEGLGRIWRMETVSHKFHACCHGLHAMLEALSEGVGDPERLEQVLVTTHPRWLSVCNIPDPASGLESKFSYRHTCAMALHGIDTAALDSFSDASAQDPALARTRDKVTVKADDTLSETQARVTLRAKDGECRELFHDLDAPLTLEDRTSRLRRKGRALIGEVDEPALWVATHGPHPVDRAALIRLMTGTPGT